VATLFIGVPEEISAPKRSRNRPAGSTTDCWIALPQKLNGKLTIAKVELTGVLTETPSATWHPTPWGLHIRKNTAV
jgi:hypothetical protein